MDRAALDSLDREGLIRIILMQFEAIERLTAEVVALRAENAELRTQSAEFRAKLDRPPKTPDNSSVPPSQGRKASIWAKDRSKRKPHAGAHRPLHPDPTRRRDVLAAACPHCGFAVSQTPQDPSEPSAPTAIPH